MNAKLCLSLFFAEGKTLKKVSDFFWNFEMVVVSCGDRPADKSLQHFLELNCRTLFLHKGSLSHVSYLTFQLVSVNRSK